MATVSSTKFLKWIWYLEWLETDAPPTRQEYYMAQNAAEIERGRMKYPQRRKIKHKLLQFITEKKVGTKTVDREAQLQHSKRCWMGGAGLTGVKHTKQKLPAKVRQSSK